MPQDLAGLWLLSTAFPAANAYGMHLAMHCGLTQLPPGNPRIEHQGQELEGPAHR